MSPREVRPLEAEPQASPPRYTADPGNSQSIGVKALHFGLRFNARLTIQGFVTQVGHSPSPRPSIHNCQCDIPVYRPPSEMPPGPARRTSPVLVRPFEES